MGSEEPEDAGALSDFDEDEELDAAPVELPPLAGPQSEGGRSVEELAAALEAERQARKVLEVAKAEGDANFMRLKALITEAARQRDEAHRQRDEASKARDAAKAEIGEVARLLIAANEKATGMAKGVKSFGRSLPASKYTGLQAIAFGFGKRVEEIVEEILRQREAALSAHRDVREQMEQRNYAVAIEVSELEASISQLKEDVSKKSSEVEVWKHQATIKDDKFLELEQVFSEKLAAAESESTRLRDEARQHKETLREASKYISKLRKNLFELPHELSHIDEPVSESMPQQCLALLELSTSIAASWKEKKEEWEKTSQEMVTRIGRLVGQKQDAADLLAAALAEKQQVLETISDLRVQLSQETLEVERLQVALKEAQEKSRESEDEEENEELVRIRAELGVVAQIRDEALSKVTALMNEVNQLRQQIGELESALAQARSEVGELRTLSNAQIKELAEKAAQIKDILVQVKGYTADIEALEEEVERWKQAATDEAAAGAAVMEDLERSQYEVTELNKQIDRFKLSGEEALLKLRSKEEMAAAAIAARTAAERSLQMADERAGELRERLEELNKQMEEADRNRDYRLGLGWLDMCCPWLRNGRRRFGDGGGTQMAAEMEELLEPLV